MEVIYIDVDPEQENVVQNPEEDVVFIETPQEAGKLST
jgi:hypothetical protein